MVAVLVGCTIFSRRAVYLSRCVARDIFRQCVALELLRLAVDLRWRRHLCGRGSWRRLLRGGLGFAGLGAGGARLGAAGGEATGGGFRGGGRRLLGSGG